MVYEFDECETGTPEHLHQKGRPVINTFTEDESLYRRYMPNVDEEEWDGIKREIRLREDSGCRSQYCSSKEDVLWKEDGEHLTSCGIFQHSIAQLHKIEVAYIVPDSGEHRLYSVQCRHDPYTCLYPHSVVEVFVNGEKIAKDKVGKIKPFIKELLRDEIQRRSHKVT